MICVVEHPVTISSMESLYKKRPFIHFVSFCPVLLEDSQKKYEWWKLNGQKPTDAKFSLLTVEQQPLFYFRQQPYIGVAILDDIFLFPRMIGKEVLG